MTLKVVVPPHPLIAHWLTMLRNPETPSALYGKSLEELSRWLTYEAVRDWLPYRIETFESPAGLIEGKVLENSVPLIAIANLPGGIEMWYGARGVLPNANFYLDNFPKPIQKDAGLILFFDQISDGVHVIEIVSHLKKQNISLRQVRIISPVASKQGLSYIGEKAPDLIIYCACIDSDLSENGDVSPGIGNPTLRLNTRP